MKNYRNTPGELCVVLDEPIIDPVCKWHAADEERSVESVGWPTRIDIVACFGQISRDRRGDAPDSEPRHDSADDELRNRIRRRLDDGADDSSNIAEDDGATPTKAKSEEGDDEGCDGGSKRIAGDDHGNRVFALRVADSLEEGLVEQQTTEDTCVVAVHHKGGTAHDLDEPVEALASDVAEDGHSGLTGDEDELVAARVDVVEAEARSFLMYNDIASTSDCCVS